MGDVAKLFSQPGSSLRKMALCRDVPEATKLSLDHLRSTREPFAHSRSDQFELFEEQEDVCDTVIDALEVRLYHPALSRFEEHICITAHNGQR